MNKNKELSYNLKALCIDDHNKGIYGKYSYKYAEGYNHGYTLEENITSCYYDQGILLSKRRFEVEIYYWDYMGYLGYYLYQSMKHKNEEMLNKIKDKIITEKLDICNEKFYNQIDSRLVKEYPNLCIELLRYMPSFIFYITSSREIYINIFRELNDIYSSLDELLLMRKEDTHIDRCMLGAMEYVFGSSEKMDELIKKYGRPVFMDLSSPMYNQV